MARGLPTYEQFECRRAPQKALSNSGPVPEEVQEMLCHSRAALQQLRSLCRLSRSAASRCPTLQATPQRGSLAGASKQKVALQSRGATSRTAGSAADQQATLSRPAAEAQPLNHAAPPLLQDVEAQLGPFSGTPAIAPPPALVVIVSGPSGVGKDAVLNRLRQRRSDIHFVVTATSRYMSTVAADQ